MPSITKVFLLSTFERPDEDTHWASPYLALRKAFTETQSRNWQLVDTPAAADLILVCPRARNPVFPIEVFRNGIAWKHRHKCVVISTDDNPTLTHKGFYTSLRAGRTRSPWLKGGFYPLVTYAGPGEAFPLDLEFQYLFSFLGSFDTHPVRREIGSLASRAWMNKHDRFLVKDTSARNRPHAHDSADDAEFHQGYLSTMLSSKFILCPRGRCPSSLRLFETMKARRVPVVISDDWVPTPEIQWDRFAVFIKEKDLPSIPAILQQEEGSFLERATAARNTWSAFFGVHSMADTVSRWGMTMVDAQARAGQSGAHLADLFVQLIRWRFLRRGLISELRRMFDNPTP
jgi:hypothetical protein